MRVIGLLPIGVLLAGTVVVGCDNAPGVSDTTADLQLSKKSQFESIVEQEDYVSNKAGVGSDEAKHDPDLTNAWGLVFSDKGFAWVAANHSGTDRVYDSEGNLQGFVVLPPARGEDIAAPTGQVINTFPRSFNGADFIVVGEDGLVTSIKVKTEKKNMIDARAKIEVDNSQPRDDLKSSNYKGVALSTVHGKPRLFAADFRNGVIDAFDDDFHQIKHPGFVDPFLVGMRPTFHPFNILAVPGERLIVAYAVPDEEGDDDVQGNGNGIIDIFDTDGTFIQRLLTGPGKHPELSSPWGMALSKEKNERKSIDLLIGNFGDANVDVGGHINVYELTMQGKRVRADFEGPLGVVVDKKAQPLFIEGLWAVVFGNDKGGFGADDIYFTAGPNGGTDALEDNGLFGELEFVSPRR